MRTVAPALAVLALLALLGVQATQAQAPAPPVKGPTVEGITEYRFANDLQVLLFPDSSKPTVTVNLTVLVGSRHEGYGESGMAHLLEHMVFKGTTKRKEIMSELTAHGAQFNGTTSWDRTNYFETMTASEENLRWALDMEADRLVNSRVSRQDLDTEMTVVRNEFERGENSAENVLVERVLSTAFLWHGYGRSPIGSRSDIENVPIERLQAFYRNYYQPDNALLVIAGKFDPEKTLGWIQETFGVIPKPTRTLMRTYTQEPTQDGEREVVLRRVGDTQNVMAAYHIPSASHPDSAALDILSLILGDQPSGRLYKALVETKKATRVEAEELELHDPGVMIVGAQVLKEGDLADVEQTMLRVVDGLTSEPPTKEEVERAKARHLKNIELMLTNSGRVGLILSDAASAGDWRLLFRGRDDIENVTPEDVARVAKAYFKPSNRTLGRFIPTAAPDRSEIPPNPDVVAMLKDYKGKAEIEQGEQFDPSPLAIEARTTRVTLPGGLKLVLLPKKTRGNTVTAAMTLHYGDEKSLNGKQTSAQLAGAMLTRGTQKHNRQQFQDELDKIKAQLNINGNLTAANLNIQTVRAGIVPALRLAAEALKEPSFPENEFEQIRQTQLAAIEQGRSEPQTIASLAMQRYVAPYPAGDPRYVPTIDERVEQLKKVTLADAKKFYTDFYGASNAELAVVGDFDANEIRKLAEELFGSWKSASPYTLITRAFQKLPELNQTFETPDKTNAFIYAVGTLAMDQQDPDYPGMFLANVIIGGDPKSRLWMRIREREGLSYGVNSSFNAGAQEKFAQFGIAAIANPGNVPKVEAAFKEEIQRLLRDGFTAEEVTTAKSAYLQEAQVSRSQDAQLARLLATQAFLGRTMQREADIEKVIGGLTADPLTTILRKWHQNIVISYFKAGDFKKASQTPEVAPSKAPQAAPAK